MNHWSGEIEEICEKLRINCVNLSEYHRKRYYTFKSYGKWFQRRNHKVYILLKIIFSKGR